MLLAFRFRQLTILSTSSCCLQASMLALAPVHATTKHRLPNCRPRACQTKQLQKQARAGPERATEPGTRVCNNTTTTRAHTHTAMKMFQTHTDTTITHSACREHLQLSRCSLHN